MEQASGVFVSRQAYSPGYDRDMTTIGLPVVPVPAIDMQAGAVN
ncbi:MAG: hypothetical protein WBO34_14830 [Gammaproteobacteria bacterium]